MAIKKCKECQHDISTKAETCPQCGAILKKKTGCLTFILWFVVIFIIITLYGITKPAMDDYNERTGSNIDFSSKPKVTFDEYNQLETNMSYSQVVSIIGEHGQETSRNHMEGVPGVMDSLVTVSYQWQNSDGGNIIIIFQNNQLNTKAQAGLH